MSRNTSARVCDVESGSGINCMYTHLMAFEREPESGDFEPLDI